MRLLTIAMIIVLSVFLYWFEMDRRTIEDVHQATQTVGFDLYMGWSFRHDRRLSRERIDKIERWARAVDPETIDAVNVRQWVKSMQSRPETKRPQYAKR